ncbi:MAG: hypothetical protein HYY56_00325 [Candidatus Omnitrophica bacterium]|nr:hypothetical protein [Candidatus Omnitrophota bacterium]
MKTIVIDSSSLILLTKCDLIEMLTEKYQVIIPDEVYGECVNEDTLKRFPDASIIENLVVHGKIEKRKASDKTIVSPVSLASGEHKAIALSLSIKGSILLTDDGNAIKACRYFKKTFIVSPGVVQTLYKNKIIEYAKAKRALEILRIYGRYSPDIIAEAMIEIEKIREEGGKDVSAS